MKLEHLSALNAERAARRAAALVTDLMTGESRVLREAELERDPMADVLAERFGSGRSAIVEHAGGQFFVTVQTPPVRIAVVGAVHISQALAPLARIAGLDVAIVDPRTAFATPERFPEVAVAAEWPQDYFARKPLDRYTALVALTHDPKIDDPALEAALRSDCFYVGALGSRKTHGARVERLTRGGFAQTEIARIHAPIGLDIGAVTPAEIAVAILGEIVAALRAGRRRS